MKKLVKYKEEDILRALNMLNALEVKGIENANRLMTAFAIVQNPTGEEYTEEEEKTDGTDKQD